METRKELKGNLTHHATYYLRALENSPQRLKQAFEEERANLSSLCYDINKRITFEFPYHVLDMGCGIGRPTLELARKHQNLKFIGIDDDEEIMRIANERTEQQQNLTVQLMDALYTTFPDNSFEITYSAYNTIGSISKKDRAQFIKEQLRVTKRGGKISNTTWKNDDATTEFLKSYYPSVGLQILEANQLRTVMNKGIIDRVSVDEILNIYEEQGVKQVQVRNIGSLWKVVEVIVP